MDTPSKHYHTASFWFAFCPLKMHLEQTAVSGDLVIIHEYIANSLLSLNAIAVIDLQLTAYLSFKACLMTVWSAELTIFLQNTQPTA